MKSRVSDYLFSPLAWLQIIILFTLLTLLALVFTPLGPLLGAWAGNTFVKELTIEGVRGSLLSSIEVDKLEWRDGNVTTLRDIRVVPGRPDFSRNQLPLKQLSVASLDVALDPTSTPRSRGELVRVGDFGIAPLNLAVDKGSLTRFRVMEAESTLFQLDNVSLDGTEINDNLIQLQDVTATMVVESESVELGISQARLDMMEPHELTLAATLGYQHADIGELALAVQGKGVLQAYQLNAEGVIEHPDLGIQSLALKGRGDFDFIDIQALTLNGDSGQLEAQGELAWVPSVLLDVGVSAKHLKTAQFVPEWPADLTGAAAVKIAVEEGKLRGGVDINALNGTVRGYPIKGSGQVSMLNNELLFEQLLLQSSDNSLKVNGRGSEPFDLSWDIQGKDLASMSAGLSGRVSAKGTLTGDLEKPIIDGQLKASRLALQGNQLESATLSLSTVDSALRLQGELRGLLLNGERIISASLAGQGDIQQHQVQLRARHTQATLNTELQGGWDGQHWQGSLNKVVLDDRTFGQWRLKKPANMTVSAQALEADELCMVATDGSACASVSYTSQEGFKTAGQLQNAPLQLLNPLIPENMTLKGRVRGDYSVALQPELKGQANLSFTAGEVRLKQEGVIRSYAYNGGTLVADVAGQNIKANARLRLSGDAFVDAKADVQLVDSGEHIIDAEGKFQALPLALGQAFLPKDIRLSGQASGAFTLQQRGTQRTGQMSLESPNLQAIYQDAVAGRQQYRFNQVTAKAQLSDDRLEAEAILGLVSGGQLNGRAQVDLSQPDLTRAVVAEGKLSAMPLALARPYLPKNVDIAGLVSGEFSLSQASGEPVGRVNLLASDGLFRFQESPKLTHRYQYRSAQLKASIQGDKLLAEAALALKAGGEITTQASADISTFSGSPVYRAEGTLANFPLALAQSYLPSEVTLNGVVSGDYQIQQQGKLTGKVRLKLPAASIRYQDKTAGRQTYRYKTSELVADIDGDKVAADLVFALQEGGSLSTRGRFDLSQAKHLYAFEGEGQLQAFPLALLEPYLSVPMRLNGVVDGKYQLTQRGGQQGTVQLRLPSGSVSLKDEAGKEHRIAYTLGELNARVKGKKITADARLTLKDGGVIDSQATIGLGATASAHQINAEGQLQSVPLALLAPYLPKDFEFLGKVNGRYSLKQHRAKRSGTLNLSLPTSYFIVKTASGNKQSFAYEQGVLNTTLEGDRVNVDSSLLFKGRGDVRLRAQLNLKRKGSPSVNGALEANIPNIYWAQPYVPYSRGLRGQVLGKVNFSGLLSKPRVTGSLSLSNGYLRLPQVGTELTEINLKVQANRVNQAVIVGSMKSGGGVIRANGSLSLQDIKHWSATMSLSGQNIQFVDTHEAKAYMTPNLQIVANPQAVIIKGTVDIPKADINLKDFPELSIDESEDVIVLNETRPSGTVASVRVRPNILVRLGNEVYFKGFGFSTQLVGRLRVTHSKNTIVTNGALNILNGRYQAYGQDLKINNGRLVFNGPPKNVGVDVRAVRTVEVGEVGIHLTGTLQKLKSTIFSNPVLQETDALSYLVTGHSLSSATGRETALLMQAVRGLGIDGSDGLIQKIGKSLGLDDLSIVTRDDFRESELQLGKKLGSKLYVRYLVGLFDSAHRIAMDYKINKYLNVEIQAGEEQSLDLIYEYEKD